MPYLKTRRSLPYIIIICSIILCIVLGIWWLYLIYKLSVTLHDVAPKHFLNMIIAEGSTFVILQIITIISAILLFRIENKKFVSMQKFYAIFSHELKTPLTTLQLQLEILPPLLENYTQNKHKVIKVVSRLASSLSQLKYEVSKMLSLSQVALSPSLPIEPLNLINFLENWITKNTTDKKFILKNNLSFTPLIMGNPSIIETILNNLLKNSEQHVPDSKSIKLEINSANSWITLKYIDDGQLSQINLKLLGQLFYKSHKSQGTGVGLFIVKHLMNLIGGKASFESFNDQFSTLLYFKKD